MRLIRIASILISAVKQSSQDSIYARFSNDSKNTPTYSRPPAQKQAWYDSWGNYGLANQTQNRQDYLRRNAGC